jgi:flagellar biosynthesis/type III secretory pathway protein FliH
MHRQTISWPVHPVAIRSRTGGPCAEITREPPPVPEPEPAVSEELLALLESIHAAVLDCEERRRQSLGELQQVAIELAVAAASSLLFQEIEQERAGIRELVEQAIGHLGLDAPLDVLLHPQDAELLERQLADPPVPWTDQQVTIQTDASLPRGGCRVESADGRILVSDVAVRLSEIRRHWMEELDDAQIERRRTQTDGHSVKRFPDRRETA